MVPWCILIWLKAQGHRGSVSAGRASGAAHTVLEALKLLLFEVVQYCTRALVHSSFFKASPTLPKHEKLHVSNVRGETCSFQCWYSLLKKIYVCLNIFLWAAASSYLATSSSLLVVDRAGCYGDSKRGSWSVVCVCACVFSNVQDR